MILNNDFQNKHQIILNFCMQMYYRTILIFFFWQSMVIVAEQIITKRLIHNERFKMDEWMYGEWRLSKGKYSNSLFSIR